jgi:single-stranded-DNA-specific exonuclease
VKTPQKIKAQYSVNNWYQKQGKDYCVQILEALLSNLSHQEKEKFLAPSLKDIPHPEMLQGMGEAVQSILEAMRQNHSILIVGDYDVDGITATALLKRFFQYIHYQYIDSFIPNRFEHGYGLTPKATEVILERNPQLVITVDNGITARKETEFLEKKNIQVIITDHHTPLENQVPHCIVINPKQNNCDFLDKNISGVGVAFMLLIALRTEMRKNHFFSKKIPEPNLRKELDLVAIGTIADQVPLIGLNRILTHFGLEEIEKHLAQKQNFSSDDTTPFYLKPFLKNQNTHTINSETIAFQLAPMLNAAGRLIDAKKGLDYLLAENDIDAHQTFEELNQLNLERRNCEKDMTQTAIQIVEESTETKCGLVLFDESFHEGVSGIVASRIVEMFHVPVVVLAKNKDEVWKGSARSIDGVSILEIFQECEELFLRYGGHVAAAGCSLHDDNLEAFKTKFESLCAKKVSQEHSTTLNTNLELEPWMISQKLIQTLQQLEPHGQVNQKPTFVLRNIPLQAPKTLASVHLKWELTKDIEMIFWKGVGLFPQEGNYDVAITLGLNFFRGNQKIQLTVKGMVLCS